jgi:hypothetical protein
MNECRDPKEYCEQCKLTHCFNIDCYWGYFVHHPHAPSDCKATCPVHEKWADLIEEQMKDLLI